MTDKSSLQHEINEAMAPLTPPPIQDMIKTMVEVLCESGAVAGLDVGDMAPKFTLPDSRGDMVSLDDRLAVGPVVLSFYRGDWCPICNIELRSLQAHLGEFRDRGASLIAVSPQTPDTSLTLAEKLALEFDVLSDLDQSVAQAFGIRFRLSEDLIALYKQIGLLLPEQNADRTWDLPVPATFVIDRSGVIRVRHVDADYRQRMEPAEVLDALDRIGN